MEIRRRLNAAEVPARRAKVWSKETIQKILTFEGYATGESPSKLGGKTYLIQCPPIIPVETWHKALEVREKNKSYRGWNVKEDYLCRGMVTCPCGWSWVARTVKGKYQHGKSGCYACPKRAHKPEDMHPDCASSIGSKKLDEYVWDFVKRICEHPAAMQQAIDARIAELQQEQGDIERDAEQLERELDRITEGRQWVITQARQKRITDDDMELQLATLDFQRLALRKQHQEKAAVLALRRQAENLKEWAAEYLTDNSEGLRISDVGAAELAEEERERQFVDLEAGRFLAKFEGDRLRALEWALLEEKRKVVRMIVQKVEVVHMDGEKVIVPYLALDVPWEFASLAYEGQSLAYVQQVGARRQRIV